MKKHGEVYDFNVRQWVLDSSINSNIKGAGSDKILEDATKFYGFLFPDNGKVVEIKKHKKSTSGD